jgi:transposase
LSIECRLFVRAYPRETQEMVFDAHNRAFALFKGTCGRGIYDNMKTAVETVFVGKGRVYNRRFLQMCSHYLVDPIACTPASGWEKGQVESSRSGPRAVLHAAAAVQELRQSLSRRVPFPRLETSFSQGGGWKQRHDCKVGVARHRGI